MQPAIDPGNQLMPHGSFRVRALLAMVRSHWFIRLRWVFAVGAVALLTFEHLQMDTQPRPRQLLFCIGVLAVINVVWTIIARHVHKDQVNGEQGTSPEMIRRVVLLANAQMTVDLLILTIILRYTGGIENPMAIFYLFHMLIAALLLRPLNALLQGGWALILYGGLGIGECLGWLTPHYPFLAYTDMGAMHTHWGYVIAGIAVLGTGVFGTLFFTLQISWRLDEQERELEEANYALQRSQTAIHDLQGRRSRFMQTAAHQLKSPLTGIEMLACLIRDGVVTGDAIKKTVERVIHRCQEAILQVAELLTLARVEEAATARHRSARTDVEQVVRKVGSRFAEQASQKGLEYHVGPVERQSMSAAVDERDLEDCLGNLIENAIKYTPEGGKVWVNAHRDDHTISISVKDTGMGIAEGSEDDIFDPYRRGNLALASSIPGSGLGLAIVREIVEQANGKIHVRSVVGRGSEFVVSFPRHNTAVQPSAVRGTRTTTMNKCL